MGLVVGEAALVTGVGRGHWPRRGHEPSGRRGKSGGHQFRRQPARRGDGADLGRRDRGGDPGSGRRGCGHLAPFGFFNALAGAPPCVMYGPNGYEAGTRENKDSLINVRETGEFVYNMCTVELLEAVNHTSAHVPSSVDEMKTTGLEAAPREQVKAPRVKTAPIAMACKVLQTLDLPANEGTPPNNVVIGQMVGIHVDDDVIVDGMIDARKVWPLARLGYLDYAVIMPENIFTVPRLD